MEALRNIYTVKDNRIVIDLPNVFNHESVEVIILPLLANFKNNENETKVSKEEQIANLLSVSVWNDDDVKAISQSQNIINQWKIEKF